jgi:hypothetical protein
VSLSATSAKRQYGTSGEASRFRVLIFKDGLLADTTHRHTLRFGVNGGLALKATSRSYLRLWMQAAWRREDFTLDPFSSPGSTFGTVGAGLEAAHTRFHVMQRLNTYGRREDVNLSNYLRVGAWPRRVRGDILPSKRGWVLRRVVKRKRRVARGYLVLYGAPTAWHGAGLDSGHVRAGLTVVSQNLEYQTLIAHIEGGGTAPREAHQLLRHPQNQSGPRLYSAHAFTGTRTIWATFEDRIVVADQAFGLVGIGLAPFFDWGGAWFGDEPVWVGKGPITLLEPMRTGNDAGISIRLGPTRAVRGDVSEIAFGYRFGAPADAARLGPLDPPGHPQPPGPGRLDVDQLPDLRGPPGVLPRVHSSAGDPLAVHP